MASAIERLFALKAEALERGLGDSKDDEGQVKIVAGSRFVDELLMEATLKWNAKFDSESMTVFGIPIVPATYPTISPNGVKLVFELYG